MPAPEKKLRPRTAARRLTLGLTGLIGGVYATPIVAYAWLGASEWNEFWTRAATPYGTVTAGLAAIAAAAIALHNGNKQRDAERLTADRDHDTTVLREMRDRFTTASKLVADTSMTMQQAGTYALGSLANDWLARGTDQEAQVCVDVLCTYLRTHHHEAARQAGKPYGNNYQYTNPPVDQSVRDTIIQLIGRHLEGPDRSPGLWSHLDFNFSDAHLHEPSLRGVFNKVVRFDGANFTGKPEFTAVTFAGCSTFANTQFRGSAVFEESIFSGQTTFSRTTFHGSANFWRSHFKGEITFREVTFERRADFQWSRFAGETLFQRVSFNGPAYFNQGKIAGLDSTKFSGNTSFNKCHFKEIADFQGAVFSGRTSLRLESDGILNFLFAKFEGETTFSHMKIRGGALLFSPATFRGKTNFVSPHWAAPVFFNGADFDGGHTHFSKPTAWKQVSTDWDSDGTLIPESVFPKEWPPEIDDDPF